MLYEDEDCGDLPPYHVEHHRHEEPRNKYAWLWLLLGLIVLLPALIALACTGNHHDPVPVPPPTTVHHVVTTTTKPPVCHVTTTTGTLPITQ